MEWPSLEEIPALFGKLCLIYVVFMMILAATLAVRQEYKIWSPKNLPTLSIWGMFKVFAFNLVWFIMCLLGSIIIVLKWVVLLGNSDIEYDGSQWVEDTAAKMVLAMFVGPVETQGLENLPDDKAVPAPVYIANHESQIDVGAVYYIRRRFKWIAKQSVLYLPGVGTIMWLSGHVLIQRKGKNRKSVSNLFDKSNQAVQSGIPMFIFPQGTRWIAERLEPKDGAFKIAIENKSDLVPISIGVPRNAWNTAYPLNLLWGGKTEPIRITVHQPIKVKGTEEREFLKRLCFDKIYSILQPVDSDQSSKKDK